MTYLLTLFVFLLSLIHSPAEEGKPIGAGIHPAVTTDPAGVVHVVYGRGGLIFYATSHDGETYSEPVLVDSVPGLHLGASRGPQIAATATSVVITAIDKAGNVWAYSQSRTTGKWLPRVRVTDLPDVAKEGFVTLTAGPGNTYNAAWLDLRDTKRNKIVGAHSTDGGRTWSANRIVYNSPDGTVCECCQLSEVSQGEHVAVMFRNSLNGSRDMYLIESMDGGKTFGKARKLGDGTWKLKACPMDGGGLFMTPNGSVSTVWRRADTLFTARPGQPETELTTGKNAKIITTPKGNYIVFQRGGQIWTITPDQPNPAAVAPGGYPKLTRLPNNRVLCLWEQEGTIRARIIG
ncbi:sialidase family protein [Spirosoma luteum]|uniref:sialidase family protein n=1 Tax=Spirosoma luteum TaxID=431553 RepID=UPI00037669C0|nr:sialidase family protein [Spirosoma luteum]